MIMTNKDTLKNRYEIECFIQAKLCNPNGDPNMADSPRQDTETGKGWISPEAIQRRVRNYIQGEYSDVEGMEVLIKEGTSMNKEIARAVAKSQGKSNTDKLKETTNSKETDAARQAACDMYWDVRTFGGVLSTGLNAGQILGAVQTGWAESLDPIEVEGVSLTRMSYTIDKKLDSVEAYEKEEQEHESSTKRTIGFRYTIPFGLYKVKVCVSANTAKGVGFTEEDLKKYLEALFMSYTYQPTSSKMGMEVVGPIVVFKHVGCANNEQREKEAKLGCAPAHVLFDLVNVHKKDDVEVPRDYKDYEASVDLSKLPEGVEVGFKKSVFGDVEYLDGEETVNLW